MRALLITISLVLLQASSTFAATPDAPEGRITSIRLDKTKRNEPKLIVKWSLSIPGEVKPTADISDNLLKSLGVVPTGPRRIESEHAVQFKKNKDLYSGTGKLGKASFSSLVDYAVLSSGTFRLQLNCASGGDATITFSGSTSKPVTAQSTGHTKLCGTLGSRPVASRKSTSK